MVIIIIICLISLIFFGNDFEKVLNNDYFIINDVMVKTRDNKTHQIDHIIVSKYGIFVIETKQYNGYIKGNEYDKRWLIKNGNKNFYVNNP